ncbi:MAG: ATP-binding cassette domain-containing protein, partial [Thermoleophilia bacterium]
TVRYGAVVALDGVDLPVPPGLVTAVVGGDGAGKTTLLRVLAGAQAATRGRVRRPPSRQIGFVSAGAGVYDDLTVAENLEFSGSAYGVRGAALAARAAPLLARARLDDVRDRLVGNLSGGMRQKLAFVRAVLHEPELLILDEPTTGVDPVSRADLWRLIAAAAAAGTAVVLATTYLDEAERAAQVLLLDEGRALATGRPEQITTAVPGTIAEAAAAPGGVAAWRRGRTWRLWLPAGVSAAAAAPGARPVTPDFADAVIVASLARHEAPAEAGGPAAGRAAPARHGSGAAVAARAPAPNAAGPLAETRAVTRRFGSFTAVDAVDVRVDPGQVVGLLGANGAGKTTVIRLLLGLLGPTDGAALLFGAPPSRAARRRLGYVPQGLGVWDDLTVDENLQFSGAAFGAAHGAAGEATNGAPAAAAGGATQSVTPAAAADPELAAHGRALVRDLSLGLRRRLAFAAALSHHPELLVLDEPTSGVAALARARLWDTIREAAEAGVGVLVTTHSLDEAEQCDRLLLMAAGRVVAQGTIDEIVGDATAVEVDCPRWDDAFRALDAAGLPLALAGRRVRVPGGDLTRVRGALDAHHVAAGLRIVNATFEETFVQITTQSPTAAAHDPAVDPANEPTDADTGSTA